MSVTDINEVRQRYIQLQAKLDKISQLHQPHESVFSGKERCLHCGYAWPCPTKTLVVGG
jgi:hypothetical protein